MRALVAEDDDSLRRILHDGLVEAGYVVDTVPDGEQALRYLDLLEYSVLILDWRMPGLDGFEVARQIRRLPWEVPIPKLFIVTAYGDDKIQRQVVEEGLE